MRLSQLFANDEVVVNPYSGQKMTYADALASNYSSQSASAPPNWLVAFELSKQKYLAKGPDKAPG